MEDDFKGLNFGSLCKIEMFRHGSENDFFTHKVIGRLNSNCAVVVPIRYGIGASGHGEVIFPKVVPCLKVVCCGVDEREVFKVRACDVSRFAAETDADRTNLLATKFVADEAVGLVGELAGALKMAATELKEYGNGVERAESPGLFCAIEQAAAALAKAAQFTAAIAPAAPTVGKRFVRNDLNRNAIFEGDTIEYQLIGGLYLNKGTIVFNDDMGTFLMLSENGIQRYLPCLSECNVFSLVGPTAPAIGGETETQIFPPVDVVAEFDEHGLGEADYYTGTTREG